MEDEIIVGETYILRLKVLGKYADFVSTVYADSGEAEDSLYGWNIPKSRYSLLRPCEPEPKYDPCRMLKKGDRVEVVKNKGRIGSTEPPVGTLATVTEDEEEAEWIYIQADGSNKIDTIDPAYLKLVTPVEEVKPYTISEGAGIIEVYNEKLEAVKAWFYSDVKAGVKALAAAEAECARLNAEHRKEMEK